MPQKMYLISDPSFGEYVFYCMANAPLELIKTLNDKERVHFRTKRAMKYFATHETMEKRLLLLAKLEIPFCLVVGQYRPEMDYIIEELSSQYEIVEKRKALIDAMSRQKIFVMSSNDVLMGLHMAAQNSHSRTYILNTDYVKLAQTLGSRKLEYQAVDISVEEAIEAFDKVSKILMHNAVNYENSVSICGLEYDKLTNLLALLPYRNTFVTANKLMSLLDMVERDRAFKKTMTLLATYGYILKMPKGKSDEYAITEKGINTVFTYMKFIVNKALYKN